MLYSARPSSSTSMENKIFIRIAVMLIVSEELCKTEDDWIIAAIHIGGAAAAHTHTHTYDEREHYDDDDEDDFMLYSNLLHSKAIGY